MLFKPKKTKTQKRKHFHSVSFVYTLVKMTKSWYVWTKPCILENINILLLKYIFFAQFNISGTIHPIPIACVLMETILIAKLKWPLGHTEYSNNNNKSRHWAKGNLFKRYIDELIN